MFGLANSIAVPGDRCEDSGRKAAQPSEESMASGSAHEADAKFFVQCDLARMSRSHDRLPMLPQRDSIPPLRTRTLCEQDASTRYQVPEINRASHTLRCSIDIVVMQRPGVCFLQCGCLTNATSTWFRGQHTWSRRRPSKVAALVAKRNPNYANAVFESSVARVERYDIRLIVRT